MVKYITKSLYQDYLKCPKNAWLKLHKEVELGDYFKFSEHNQYLIEQGMQVEKLAQKLFTGGISLQQFGINTFKETLQHIQNKTSVLFQPTFIYDCFYARSDVLKYDAKSDQWNLYEIKSTSRVDKNAKEIDHIADAAFQVEIMQRLGIKVGSIFIVHLDKEYVLEDTLVVKNLFQINDQTDEVQLRIPKTIQQMKLAKTDFMKEQENDIICSCIYKGASSHCETFHYSHPHIPDYSVYNISRIGNSKRKLKELVDLGITDIKDVPADFESKSQNIQVKSAKQGEIFIDRNAIKQELESLKYPLYFLDYEAFLSAVPRYRSFSPYEYVTFQFSLHVVQNEYSEPVHYEYLHEQDTDPTLFIIHELQKNIESIGSVVVWHKDFENKRNEELGERYPEMKQFFSEIITRTYDLKEIFSSQLYVHPDFRGSASIKKVLPALFPDLNHKNLDIQEGLKAVIDWYKMIAGDLNTNEKEKIKANLKEYCKLDSYAMYKIWKHLVNIVNEFPQKNDLYSYRDIFFLP